MKNLFSRIGFSIMIISTAAGLTGCVSKAKKQAYDDGYKKGSSDSIKRSYWLKQGLEKKTTSDTGQTYYIVQEAETTTEDGRKLVPTKTVSPIKE